MGKFLRNKAIAQIRDWFLTKPCGLNVFSRQSGIAATTVARYSELFTAYEKRHPGRLKKCKDFRIFNPPTLRKKYSRDKSEYKELIASLPKILKTAKSSMQQPVYEAYRQLYPNGYQWEGFRKIYRNWRKEHNIQVFDKIELAPISEADRIILKQWRQRNDHDKWKKAVVILGAEAGMYLAQLEQKTDANHYTIKGWITAFNTYGIAGLTVPPKIPEAVKDQVKAKKEGVFKLIHESPKLHGFNRPTWRLEDLATAYTNQYQQPISMATIALYLKEAGYKFKKARLSLTSPDPKFREKLAHIQNILAGLQPNEKFFSFDEMGPFAIRMKQGWQFLPEGEVKIVPQRAKSKGYLICTATVELSTNQVTHFYSKAKNSVEIIKLIDLLLEQYHDNRKLYLSGDAVSWHCSTMIKDHVEQVNRQAALGKNPALEMALLPSSAQFLNVIESVFSGLCKAVIHNSDYASVEDCKTAIDQHFSQRNKYFQQHPKRAGNKLWGKETVKPGFSESNNCKDPRANGWVRYPK